LVHGGAGQRAKLNGKDIRPHQAKAQTTNTQERVGLSVLSKSPDWFVAARIEGPDRHRTFAGPAKNSIVCQVLRLLVWQSALLPKQKLGAHQANAVGILRIRVLEVPDVLDIDQEAYLLATP
jgi:hypothetical protein